MIKLEDSLNGGYPGLFSEVVTNDTYRLRTLDFEPCLVFDIGANVGIFTRHARALWREAKIVSVEPDPENCAILQAYTVFDPCSGSVLLQRALGKGQIYHGTTARNGSGETYLSAGLGYPRDDMETACLTRQGLELSDVMPISLPQLYAKHWDLGMRTVLKIDCEGAENCLWEDAPSMEMMHMTDYICMEIHAYALHGGELLDKVRAVTAKGLKQLEATHTCERDGVHFYARRNDK